MRLLVEMLGFVTNSFQILSLFCGFSATNVFFWFVSQVETLKNQSRPHPGHTGTDTEVRAAHRNDGHVGRVERGFSARYSLALRATAVQGALNEGHDQSHEGEVGALGMASAAVTEKKRPCIFALPVHQRWPCIFALPMHQHLHLGVSVHSD